MSRLFLRYVVPRRKEGIINIAIVCLLLFGLYLYANKKSRHDSAVQVQQVQHHPRDIGEQNRPGARYIRPDYSKSRTGPGENGHAVVPGADENEAVEKDMKDWFMNVHASDKISLDRSIPDVRREECRKIQYDLKTLPDASVVIIFTDEAWTPLIRTVHSVVNRSPPELLREVILLDDFSQREELKGHLDEYVKQFDGLVKIIRSDVRLGLIRAKLLGGKHATGEVVVFLDSHCEATIGWLEPIVARIQAKPSAVVCPIIDHIDAKTLAYSGDPYATSIGGFSWALHFTWEGMSEAERSRRTSDTQEIRSPTMAGGLLAANRKYFFDVGGYDAEMDIWGGENLEISFRVWMCGGSIEFIPCSHVGHIFRAGHPYNMTGRGGNKDVHGTNSKRLADVWMDDYKRLYYLHRPDLRTKDVGDISDRKALREKLQCKSFKWYLDNIIPGKFVLDEDVLAYGMAFTKVSGVKMCLDTLQRDEKLSQMLGVYHCQSGGSSAQVFSLSNQRHLRREDNCAQVEKGTREETGRIRMQSCAINPQTWTQKGSQLVNDATGLCLSTKDLKPGDDVIVVSCDSSDAHQLWTFQKP
ncbi:unnamed protein product, partial [Mesorhabditis belari]|uniref:Polypeptide N-acetylgalactosaminyltransferase n=1 Tax=Mesorhabditis belari TaxID=2138241 RepID=A0AAF3FJA8_9BILA